MFWKKVNENILRYSRSSNGGKTWTSIVLARDVTLRHPPSIGIDNEIVEGALYAQYFLNRDIRVSWSKDHGETWLKAFKAGSDFNAYNDIALCGSKGKGKLFTLDGHVKPGNGFVRYLEPYGTFFTGIKYPFAKANTIVDLAIDCGYKGNNQYSVAAIIHRDINIVEMAYGTLNDASLIQS